MSNAAASPARPRANWATISDFLSFWLRSNPLSGVDREVFDVYYTGYRNRFGAYMRHHFSNQSDEMTALLRQNPGASVLEVGSGCGTESLWFAFLGGKVTGIDLETERVLVARARLKWMQEEAQIPLQASFHETSLFEFEPAEPFDFIWMEQAFHHIEPRAAVFPRLFQMLRPGGRLVVSESNAWNVPTQMLLFRRRGFRTKRTNLDPQGRAVEYGDERITTPFALCRGLKNAGFEVEMVRSFRIFPNVDLSPPWLKVEKAVLKVLPWLSTHFNVVARRPAADGRR